MVFPGFRAGSFGAAPRVPQKMRRLSGPAGSLVLFVPLLPVLLVGGGCWPLSAQAGPDEEASSRLWGRVHTVRGEVLEGFLRWGRTKTHWADLLWVRKRLAEVAVVDWTPGGELVPPQRVVEYGGYRVTWDEEDLTLPETTEAGLRFGHVAALRVLEGDSVRLELRWGGRVGGEPEAWRLEPVPGVQVVASRGSPDLGPALRQIWVEVPGKRPVAVPWRDLREVEFFRAPEGAAPAGSRLFGTVEDRQGRTYSGYLAWSDRQVMETDTLNLGRGRRVRMGEVAAFRRRPGGVELTLRSGEVVEARYLPEFGSANLLRVSDPALGVLEIRWGEVTSVSLHPPGPAVSALGKWESFTGKLLSGTVVTSTGEELSGWVLWDADEGGSWEILDGRQGGARLYVEMGQVAAIERVSGGREDFRGARVLLRDSRILELHESNDVDVRNRGILVKPRDLDPAGPGAGPWIRVRWDDFGALYLEPGRQAPGAGQEAARRPSGIQAEDAFLDPTARTLFQAARAHWQTLDRSVVRYTALVQQRIAAGIRTSLKDRTLYRNETAVRAFWDREHAPLLQVLGVRTETMGEPDRRDPLWWLDELTFDRPFEPGGDQLFFGLGGVSRTPGASGREFWVHHPLARGADTLYRYRSGDTLTLSLPDGRRLRAVQLDVLPRVADPQRITGTLWIETESGALVRGVYRLSRTLDVMRDVPAVREQAEGGEFRLVPGFLKPWTLELSVVTIDYSLWQFKVWLPRAMRLEGEVAVGVMRVPVVVDVAYTLESVTTAEDLPQPWGGEPRPGLPPGPPLQERHFPSRAQAMAFLASLMSQAEGVPYAQVEGVGRGNDTRLSRLWAPSDPSRLPVSPHLPPPVWQDAPGFTSGAEVEEALRNLAHLPPLPFAAPRWEFHWGWGRHDLLRYNRVEGVAVGARGGLDTAGPWGPLRFEATAFLGLADKKPKLRLEVEQATVLRRSRVGLYRELRTVELGGRALGLGNSLMALLAGRDDGEYFLATGGDLKVLPPSGRREGWWLRAYAERQDPVANATDFSFRKALGAGSGFRPNLPARPVEELGGEAALQPWWGSEAWRLQAGLSLYLQGAAWRDADGTDFREYLRASGVGRIVVPVGLGGWRVGLEGGGGTTWGGAPPQRSWLLGGPATLRGYGASVLGGDTFLRGRLEVGRTRSEGAFSWQIFADGGWAGAREGVSRARPLYGLGVGWSLLDGLIRLDLSRGLTGAARIWRMDLYLDAIL